MVHPDGQVLQQESPRGLSIGEFAEPVTALVGAAVVERLSILSEHMCKRYMGVQNSILHHFAGNATKKKENFMLTLSW